MPEKKKSPDGGKISEVWRNRTFYSPVAQMKDGQKYVFCEQRRTRFFYLPIRKWHHYKCLVWRFLTANSFRNLRENCISSTSIKWLKKMDAQTCKVARTRAWRAFHRQNVRVKKYETVNKFLRRLEFESSRTGRRLSFSRVYFVALSLKKLCSAVYCYSSI